MPFELEEVQNRDNSTTAAAIPERKSLLFGKMKTLALAMMVDEKDEDTARPRS